VNKTVNIEKYKYNNNFYLPTNKNINAKIGNNKQVIQIPNL